MPQLLLAEQVMAVRATALVVLTSPLGGGGGDCDGGDGGGGATDAVLLPSLATDSSPTDPAVGTLVIATTASGSE